MSSEFKRFSITVNGIQVELDVDLDLHVGALSGDMDKVASQMGFWGAVWAAAAEEHANVTAQYRRWRAQKAEAVLAVDKKLAEWKVKNKIEADPQFLAMKAAQAKAERHVILARAVFDSFDKKSNQLQSKGAMSRSELDATGMATPTTKPKRRRTKVKPTKHAPAEGDERTAKMKDMFGGKGKKKATT
jgi:hypothetical protein